MKSLTVRLTALLGCVLLSTEGFSQASTAASPNYLLWSLIVVGILILVAAIISLSDNLLQIEAEKHGVNTEEDDFGLFPSLSSMFGKTAPKYAGKGKYHKLSKGFDIKLVGASTGVTDHAGVTRFAVKPQNFNGMSPIPKVVVEAGDEVKAGDVIYFDKKVPNVQYVSPVSGEIVEVVRGAKRSIAEIVILADKENTYAQHETPNVETASREDLVNYMMASGAWSLLNQRPFDIVPAEDAIPKNIFISTFSSAPLAVDMSLIAKENITALQKAIDVLTKLTPGKVYLGLDAKVEDPKSSVFGSLTGAEKHWFAGKHPYGNVGVQIHHMAPIANGTTVWTLGVNEMVTLGHLFLSGEYKTPRYVAVTGAGVTKPVTVKTYQGANVGDLVANNLNEGNNRIIAGDVLTGQAVEASEYLNFKDSQVTVLSEGDYYELFGWLLPINPRPSISRTFPAFLMPNFEFEGDTNTHGESRAFVVSGQYESVLPMDIYPQYLMKAIMTGDFEKMEGLGINELSEEDVALCEFVCTSKQPLQSILRDGLDMMQEQL